EVFELPAGSAIRQVKVWSEGWLADGIQFIIK
ncbi:hypothetical protein B9J87_09130, partial [Vibrio sp. V19_P1S1T109]